VNFPSESAIAPLELNYTNFKPKDEIIQIIDTLEGLINEKEISLNYTLADITLSADIKRFRQLIYNLISNKL
jgi:signal transduction histidine kinase